MRPSTTKWLFLFSILLAAGSAAAQVDKKAARQHIKEGDKLSREGEYERAVIAYEKSYEADKNHNTLIKVAEAETSLNNHERAITAYQRFLDEGGTKVPRGRRKAIEKKITDLKTHMEEAKSKGEAKKKAAKYFKRGLKYKKEKNHERAVRDFETAYGLYPNYQILYSLGTSQAALGQNEKAVKSLKQYLADGGDNVESKKRAVVEKEIARLEAGLAKSANMREAKKYFDEGHAFYARGQYERAAHSYEKAHKAYPTYKVRYALGKTYVNLDRNSDALDSYQKYLSEGGSKVEASRRSEVQREVARLKGIVGEIENEKKAEAHYKNGLELYGKGDYSASSSEFTRAYKLKPDFRYLYPYAQSKGSLKEYGRAVKAYKRYLAEGGTKIPAARKREVDKEIARLEPLAAKSADRKKAAVHYKTGISLARKGKHDAALAEFEKAYFLHASYKILYSTGRSQAKLGRNNEAIESFDRYLTDGGKDVKQDKRAYVEKELERLKGLQKKSANKTKAVIHYDQGVAFAKAGQYERAETEFEKAYELSPSYKILYPLAVAQAKLSHDKAALESYKRYLREGGSKVSADRQKKVNAEIDRLESSSARSEDKAKSRMHFEKGKEFQDKEDWEAAISEFEKAYSLYPSYKILYPLAQCYAGAERNAEALETYTKYQKKGDAKMPATRRDEVRTEIRRLYTLVGIIEIECAVRDAEVLVDGKVEGRTPLTDSLFVNEGEHTVLVRLDREELLNKKLKLGAGERVALQVKTELGAGAMLPPEPDELDDEDEEPAEEEEDEDNGEKPKRLWTWVSFGVGGGALIGAVITGALAVSKKNDVLDKCPDNQCPPDQAASINDEIDTVRGLGIATDVLGAVAIVGAAAGTLLFFFEPKWISGGEVNVSPTAWRDGGGISISGSF